MKVQQQYTTFPALTERPNDSSSDVGSFADIADGILRPSEVLDGNKPTKLVIHDPTEVSPLAELLRISADSPSYPETGRRLGV